MDAAIGRESSRAIPQKIRRAVLRSAIACCYCETSAFFARFEVDHVHPWSRGGTHDPENLVAACARCNLEKSDMTVSEWRAWREATGRVWPPRRTDEVAHALCIELTELLLAAGRGSEVPDGPLLDAAISAGRDYFGWDAKANARALIEAGGTRHAS